MEENKITDTAALLEVHIAEHQVSQSQVARSCGVSTAALSQWLKGIYSGNSETIDDKVKDYLAAFGERLALNGLDKNKIVRTANLLAAQRLLNICLTKQIIGLLIGNAGFGKTTAIRDYATKRPNTILIEADMGYTPTVFFNKLSGMFGIDRKLPLHDKFELVIEKLKDTGRLLIIDEAEWLPPETLEYVRRINDKAGIGIALCGLKRLQEVFSNRSNFLQLSSRVRVIRDLSKLTKTEFKSLVLELSGTDEIDEDALELGFSRSHGNCRITSHLADWSAEGMKSSGSKTITKEIMQAAIDMVVSA